MCRTPHSHHHPASKPSRQTQISKATAQTLTYGARNCIPINPDVRSSGFGASLLSGHVDRFTVWHCSTTISEAAAKACFGISLHYRTQVPQEHVAWDQLKFLLLGILIFRSSGDQQDQYQMVQKDVVVLWDTSPLLLSLQGSTAMPYLTRTL